MESDRPICARCLRVIHDMYNAMYNGITGESMCSWCSHNGGEHMMYWTVDLVINKNIQN